MRPYRTAAVGAVAATLSALAVAPPSALASAPASASVDAGSGLVLVATRHSLLGTHQWYQQTFHGVPVLHGYYVRHTDRDGHVSIDDGRLPVPASLPVSPDVAATTARARAAQAAPLGRPSADASPVPDPKRLISPPGSAAASTDSRLAVLGGPGARLVWQVVDTGAGGSSESLVDAATGAVVSRRSLVKSVTGHGQVFSPNPVVGLHDEALRDRSDADQAVLTPAYRTVTLTGLDTSGKLRGTYARIQNSNVASSSTHRFVYTRHDDRFEQVSAYADITDAQAYLHSLGFTDVNTDSQKVKTDTIPDDNSFYDPATDMITFGNGGVDDAEDQEVVWHELGHAIQDSQVPGFGTGEQAGAIGEGFGDYWAVTMSQPVSNGFDLPCVADWDATSYTSGPRHCLRRTDGTKTTADIDGEVHDDGEIWSRALWDIHRALGRTKADRVIVESQFDYSPGTSFAAAARHVVSTAAALYGSAASTKVHQAFVARRILS